MPPLPGARPEQWPTESKNPANLLSLALNLLTFGVILGVLWEMLLGIPI
jgi:hypothetical protein